VPPPTPTQLGTAIRQTREATELSIEALAARAGISWRYLSQIERGKGRSNPSWLVLSGIADGLGLKLSELAQRAEEVAERESA
jgi:transcriptional regulator with XRE-family HTH domain